MGSISNRGECVNQIARRVNATGNAYNTAGLTQYVGHTTARVYAIFERNGVIILDETYSLTEGENRDNRLLSVPEE